jgi:hypothetical protein
MGPIDEQAASALEKAVAEAIGTLEKGTFNVVFNLRGVTDVSLDARPVLVKVQKLLATKAKRTAYYDDRPTFRGLALWIAHLAGDPNTKALGSFEQVQKWLSEDIERTVHAQQLLGVTK